MSAMPMQSVLLSLCSYYLIEQLLKNSLNHSMS